jgi:hypothetical protein
LAEAAVKTVKQMLIASLNQRFTSWIDALPIVQLAYNNTPHTSTGFSPNELTFGSNVMEAFSTKDSTVPGADALAASIEAIRDIARANLRQAQTEQAKYFNRNRRDLSFAVGDKVLLSTDGLTLPVSPKYTEKYIGPLTVLEVRGCDNYKLELPPGTRIHPVFHVSKLHRYKEPATDSLQQTLWRPSPDHAFDGEEFFAVDDIVSHRFRRTRKSCRKEYLIKWQGYGASDMTWEPADRLLTDAPDIIRAYENRVA